MADMKPTIDQILKRKFAGQSVARVKWNDAKKKAAAAGLKDADLKAAFKDDLGPHLDVLNQLYQGAKEVKKFYPKLDDRTLKPVKERTAKIDTLVKNYKKICAAKAKDKTQSAAQQKAWLSLDTALTLVEQTLITVQRDVLRG